MQNGISTTTAQHGAEADQLAGGEHSEWPISDEMETRLLQMHRQVMEYLPYHCEHSVAVPFIPMPGETYTPELRMLLEVLTVELAPWLASLNGTWETPAVYFNLGGVTVMAHGCDYYLEPQGQSAD